MRSSAVSIFLLLIVSPLLSFAGEVKRIEIGDFRVEYQILGKVKSLDIAASACHALAEDQSWHLPSGVEFWATLMTGNSPFTTVPADPKNTRNSYLGWIAEADVPRHELGLARDVFYSVTDGKGTGGEFVSILKAIEILHVLAGPEEAEEAAFVEAIIRPLREGIQVVCYRTLADEPSAEDALGHPRM